MSRLPTSQNYFSDFSIRLLKCFPKIIHTYSRQQPLAAALKVQINYFPFPIATGEWKSSINELIPKLGRKNFSSPSTETKQKFSAYSFDYQILSSSGNWQEMIDYMLEVGKEGTSLPLLRFFHRKKLLISVRGEKVLLLPILRCDWPWDQATNLIWFAWLADFHRYWYCLNWVLQSFVFPPLQRSTRAQTFPILKATEAAWSKVSTCKHLPEPVNNIFRHSAPPSVTRFSTICTANSGVKISRPRPACSFPPYLLRTGEKRKGWSARATAGRETRTLKAWHVDVCACVRRNARK